MLKILTSAQTRLADEYTIAHQPISSTDLMERACKAFVKVFVAQFNSKKTSIHFYCGTGNNGGDGLAIARLLFDEGYKNIQVYIAHFSQKSSPDFDYNLSLLQNKEIFIYHLAHADDLQIDIHSSDVLVDALMGSGLNRPLGNEWTKLIKQINQLNTYIISVDITSGMPAEGELFNDTIVCADWVITFQRPKLNFLLPISNPYIKKWKVVDIGLDENYIEAIASPYHWFWKGDVSKWIKKRLPFTHKGNLGHALIVAGNTNTMGAALLVSEACHKSGAGLTSAMIPESGLTALNSRIPEVMYFPREEQNPFDLSKFSVIAIGSGLGTEDDSLALLTKILSAYHQPMVIDADAINLLGKHPDLLSQIPKKSVLTPHIKEFDRLFGEHQSWWDRIATAFKQAILLDVYIVLKNRYTLIFNPEGYCYFNSSGSPAMASAGMGDTLTGMICSLMAQNFTVEKAVLCAVFTHAYIGEQLSKKMYAVSATQIIKQIPFALNDLANY